MAQQHVNVVHNMGPKGMLHCFSAEGNQFARLRQRCADTPFRATFSDVGRILDEPTLRLLFQTNDQGVRQIVKGVDGHVAVIQGTDGEKRIQAFIRDAAVCRPGTLNAKELNDGIVHAYVIVHPPKAVCPPFILREGHEGVLPAHEISSFSPIDHMIAQVAAAIPLEHNSPRVIFESPNIGTLNGVMLRGEPAHLVKSNFLKLVSQTGGGKDMYDVPIELTPELSQALMLNNPSGFVCCAKLKNGIMGYRERTDGGKTFIFVCNSHDFFNDAPTSDVSNSTLQLFKMTYADPTVGGPRVSIQITGNEYKKPPCKYNTPVIRLDMTVQDVLNIIEFVCRNAMLEHLGCHEYPAEWHKASEDAEEPMDSDGDDLADNFAEQLATSGARRLGG
jgi:hypothetical protein